MRRRQFITLLGGASAWPLAARAQQRGGIRRIGLLMASAATDAAQQSGLATLTQALRQLGWVEGENIRIDVRWTGGDAARAKDFAAELVALKSDVILANGTLSLAAARKETGTIPIVFAVVHDPVGQGFVTSLSRPGGNITGFTSFEFSTAAKWLEVLKEIAPQAKRIAVIFNAEAAPYAKNMLQAIAAIAPSSEAQLVVNSISDAVEIERAIAGVAGSNGGLIVIPDNFTVANRGIIISLAARYRLPAVYPYRLYAVDGGLLSYGATVNGWLRGTASYVDRILRGATSEIFSVQHN